VNKQDRSARSGSVAAYRQGLGLVAVAVICSPAGIRIAAIDCGEDSALAAAETTQTRWWCRRATDAERVVAAATARLRRLDPRVGGMNAAAATLQRAQDKASDAVLLACESIASAAKQLHVVLHTEDEIFDEAMDVIARINGEIERMQRSGQLKSVNKSYQAYRIEASARGEKILRYREWMRNYRENLVRKLAATLRYF
jgi:hypothetical protein